MPPPQVSAPAPKRTLEAQLLGLLNLGSFEQAGADAETRVRGGLLGGWVDPIHDRRNGFIINYRKRSYASMIEAGIDNLIEQLPDQVIAQAKRLQPLARRYVLLRERDALATMPVREPALQRPQQASVAAERAPSEPADFTESGNRRAMIARRLAVEQDARDFKREQFAERNRHLIGDPAPDPSDATLGRIRIDAALREWNVFHPELAEALALERA